MINGRWKRLRIVGIALSPEYIYEVGAGSMFPDNKRFGVLWMGHQALSAAFDMEGAFNDVALSLSAGAVEADVSARLDLMLERYGGLVAYGRGEQISHRFISDEISQNRISSTWVPAIFFGVATFLLHLVLSRLVALQRTQIGLLKAFGYGNATVGMHYLKLAVATVLAGVALGTAAGLYLGESVTSLYRDFYRFPHLAFQVSPRVVGLGVLISLAGGRIRGAVLGQARGRAASGRSHAARAARELPRGGVRASAPAALAAAHRAHDHTQHRAPGLEIGALRAGHRLRHRHARPRRLLFRLHRLPDAGTVPRNPARRRDRLLQSGAVARRAQRSGPPARRASRRTFPRGAGTARFRTPRPAHRHHGPRRISGPAPAGGSAIAPDCAATRRPGAVAQTWRSAGRRRRRFCQGRSAGRRAPRAYRRHRRACRRSGRHIGLHGYRGAQPADARRRAGLGRLACGRSAIRSRAQRNPQTHAGGGWIGLHLGHTAQFSGDTGSQPWHFDHHQRHFRLRHCLRRGVQRRAHRAVRARQRTGFAARARIHATRGRRDPARRTGRPDRACDSAGICAGCAGLLALTFLPDPVPIDVASAQRGPLAITVDEDGETRARDRYVISAPVAGRVRRIDLREGDRISADQVVAEIWPLPLSARERDEQLARIAAADALSREAEERVRHAATDHDQAVRELSRTEKLVKDGFVSPQAVEQAQVAQTTSANELAAAPFRARSVAADAKAARAALMAIEGGGRNSAVPLRSPVAGQILRVPERSERVVAPGTPLMIVGDPQALEIVIDVLSSEAVRIKPGMEVRLEGWGGPRSLRATVRLVEPFAFTKVSALGVEEQRVNVIADFIDPPQALGDAYRVEARIVLWNSLDVLKIPSNALFRKAGGWAVFVADGRRARLRSVKPGQAGPLETEILEGLAFTDRVVVHPSNDIADGTRIQVRK